jgi:predicted nucleotidyltransferase
MDKDFIMNRLFEHMNDVGNKKIIYIALQGSQNYKLDTEESDIDTKAFVLPSFRDIVLNKKPESYTHEMENLEHCDVKDI